MSNWTEQSQDWHELAQLSPGDPRRRELEKRLEDMPADVRAYWVDVMTETDRIYAELTSVEMPPALQENLLRIPDAPLPISRMRRVLSAPIGWKHYAAAVLLLLGLIRGAQWYMQPPKYSDLPQLNQSLANAIARMAVSHEGEAVQVAGSDLTAVQEGMEKLGLPFTPMVLHPTGKVALLGGGAFKYQSTPIAFTRWSADGINYTLYQFDPHAMGIPPLFAKTTDTLASAQRVVLWPGADGTCTWALVLDNPKARNFFSASYNF